MQSSRGSRIPPFKIKFEEKGKIRDIKEMIVRIEGLPSCLNGQIVNLADGVKGIIMGFNEESVLALVLGDHSHLRMGQAVIGSSDVFRVPVGYSLLGRMVSALGEPCDQGPEIVPDAYLPVLRDSIPITGRAPLTKSFATGTKIVDMLFPLAKGQRQLILGDRITGKTTFAIDAILNQVGKGAICIYCCIGKSVSGLQKVLAALHEGQAMGYTTLVAATDNAPVGEQYLVPFAAAAIGEYFVSRGEDVVMVLDDLTKHAWAYRQLSLLMDRPPGREAYPGDIFYVQTQLMERAGCFSDEHGGGTMTFLGIAETLMGDLTGLIPSNLASMCDGQIYMNSSIFAEGFRPAVDLNLSLSIVGGKVQPPILKQLRQNITADYARYAEVVRLSRVSSGISTESERIVRRGDAIRGMLMQEQYRPVSVAENALLLFALQSGVLDGLDDPQKALFRRNIYGHAAQHAPGLIEEIEKKQELTPSIAEQIQREIEAYMKDQRVAA